MRTWFQVPTSRENAAQETRRLRRDLEPFGVVVEQLTGAIEIDVFEEALLTSEASEPPFHILVSTPEKLQLVTQSCPLLDGSQRHWPSESAAIAPAGVLSPLTGSKRVTR